MIDKFNSQTADDRRLIVEDHTFWLNFYGSIKRDDITKRENDLKEILRLYDLSITKSKTVLIDKLNFSNGDDHPFSSLCFIHVVCFLTHYFNLVCKLIF